MGSAGDPDGGRGRDGSGDDVPETLGPADSRASDRGVDDGYYEESDGDVPYGEDAGLEDPAYDAHRQPGGTFLSSRPGRRYP